MLLAGWAPLRGQPFAVSGGGQSRAVQPVCACRARLQSRQQPTFSLPQELEPPAEWRKEVLPSPIRSWQLPVFNFCNYILYTYRKLACRTLVLR